MKNFIKVVNTSTKLFFRNAFPRSISPESLFSELLFSKQRMRVTAVVLSLVVLQSCGGGGGGGGNGGELQLYRNAITAYNAANFSSAATLFEQQLDAYPNGANSDEAEYKLGRSYQAIDNFTAARTAYSVVSMSGPWLDNASFYSARSYFDEGNTKLDPVAAFADFNTALTQLNSMIATYATSNLVDGATYYLGRTYHDQATLVQDTPNLSVKTAQQLFIDARNSYDTVQATSVYSDNALYFKGRTYHQDIPPDYANARMTYQLLITANISSWADDAKYQHGKTYYDTAKNNTDPAIAMSDFDMAIVEFNAIINSTDPLYVNGNRADSASYYKGRSIHRQAELVEVDPALGMASFAQYFINARVAYQTVISLDAIGSYADNAQYQIGKTYFDEAKIALNLNDYPVMQQNLSDAIAAFTVVTTDTVYQLSNAADNAHYQLGRSYQTGAEIPGVDRVPVINGIDFTAVTFSDARSQYEVLTGVGSVAPRFPTSSWIDNAYYEIGNTWYAEAQTSTSPVTEYNMALINYNIVLSNYRTVSIREDNAATQIGIIYHETGYCAQEQAAYIYQVNSIASASAISLANANTHLIDLAISPPVTHSCVQSPSGLQDFTQM